VYDAFKIIYSLLLNLYISIRSIVLLDQMFRILKPLWNAKLKPSIDFEEKDYLCNVWTLFLMADWGHRSSADTSVSVFW